ncbi:mitochondrial import receptor subunit OR translocase-domain-containing protein [Whalleya microplaca]|nr:mitochondrial import receptor subunit OR translocase-domain-containing protein [Whalleya microplaca]
MFGGFGPPQLSKEEIAALEVEASSTVERFVVASVLLYFCKLSATIGKPYLYLRTPLHPLTNMVRSSLRR